MSKGKLDWAETGLRLEDTDLSKEQVELLLPEDITTWRASEVAQWVRSLNPTFGPEAMIFDDEGIDGEMLLTLDDDIMKNELKVESTLHRKKILSNIQKRKAEWEMKFGEPEPAPVPAPTPPPAEKKSKKDPSKKEKKSKKSSKSSKSSSKKSSKSSKRSPATKKGKKSGGGGGSLDDATLDESRMIDFLKFCGCKKSMERELRVLFRYLDRKKKKEIKGKDFRKAMIRFIPSKKEESTRNKVLKYVKEREFEKKWAEFASDGGDDAGAVQEDVQEEEEESEEEEQVFAETPGVQDPDYDDFYDSPYIDDIDPYQLQLDVDRQGTIIVAQKNRIFELEERVQKQMDLHAMELRQLREKHVDQLKQGEAHMEKKLQQMREKHIAELEGVRDRAKNLKDLKQFGGGVPSSVDDLDEQMEMNSQLRAQIRDLERELKTANEFLEGSGDSAQLERVKAQLDTAVEMISQKEKELVQITNEKEDLMEMCKNLTMQLVGGTASAPRVDVTKTQQRLRQLELSPSQSNMRSREEIAKELEQAAVMQEVSPRSKKRRGRHIRGESIDQFKQRLSLHLENTGGGVLLPL